MGVVMVNRRDVAMDGDDGAKSDGNGRVELLPLWAII